MSLAAIHAASSWIVASTGSPAAPSSGAGSASGDAAGSSRPAAVPAPVSDRISSTFRGVIWQSSTAGVYGNAIPVGVWAEVPDVPTSSAAMARMGNALRIGTFLSRLLIGSLEQAVERANQDQG